MSTRLRNFIVLLLTVFCIVSITKTAFSDNRYWVNGSGSWHDTNHWSEVSGGKPGASVPTYADNVIFDNNSFSVNGQQVIIKEIAECNDFRWEVENVTAELKSKSFLFKSLTKSEIQVHGSLIINENISNKFFGDIVLKADENKSIYIKTELNSDIILDAKHGEYQLNENLSTLGDIYLKEGTFITNDKNINVRTFIGSGTGTRALYLGNSEISIDIWDFQNDENLSFDAGNSNLLFKKGYADEAFKPGNLTYNTFSKPGAKSAFGYSINVTDVTCYGEINGEIEAVITSGGTQPFTYVLYEKVGAAYSLLESSGATASTSYTFNPTKYSPGLPAGTYLVDITDNDGDVGGGIVLVSQPDELIADSVGVNVGLTCFGSSDAELEAYASGGTEPYSYQWQKWNGSGWDDLGIATKTISGVDQGWYQVIITDFNGCGPSGFVSTNLIFIRGYDSDEYIPEEVTFDNIDFTNSCTGANNGTITLEASGGIGDIDYYLIRQSDLVVIPAGPPYDEDGVITGLQPDTYETYAIDENGCVEQGTDVIITNLLNPTASIIPDDPIICPGATVNLNGNPTFNEPGSSAVSHAWTGDIADFSPTNAQQGTFTGNTIGSYNLTYTITDNNGCIGTDNVTVTVGDTDAPTAVCRNITVQLDATGNVSITASQVNNGSFDNCTAPASLVLAVTPNTFDCSDIGINPVTLRVTDQLGNWDECSANVTIEDVTAPSITCPSNVSVNNDAGLCTAVVNGLAATTNDNCGVTLVTWSMTGATVGNSPGAGINDISGTTFNSGVTTITYHAEDASGNFSECTFTVTVNDTESPTVNCPANVITNNDAGLCSAIVNGLAPVTSDNCAVTVQRWTMSGATSASSPATGINDISGTTFNRGITTVTYHIEDAAGNSDECNFTVTVNDIESPSVTCPANVITNNDAGLCSAVVNGLTPTTSDNCGITLQTWSMLGATTGNSAATGINDISGTSFNVGTTTVTYHVEDAQGNFDECSFTVTVNDTENPTITCPTNKTVNSDAGVCTAVVNGLAPTTDDNCGVTLQTWSMTGATIGNSPAGGINDISGTTFNSGITTITYHIEDAVGNFDECNFTVNVIDNEPPTVNCPANVNTINDAGLCSAIVNGLAPVTSDNCAVTLQRWSMSGATTGNSPATGINNISGTTFNVGVTTVTYHIEDAAGNSDECTFSVTIVDTENPTISCPADVITNNSAGLCTAVVNGLSPTTDDNCGVVLQTWSMAGATVGNSPTTGINDISGTSFNSGTTTVTYYIEDAEGNSDNCSFTVTVNDTENPSVTCPTNKIVSSDPGVCTAVVNGLTPTASDNCGITLQTWSMAGATVGSSPAFGINDISGTTFNSGTTTITYHIEDAAGNFDECSFTVTVNDNENPSVTCPGNITVNNDAGVCTAVVNGLAATTNDNCGVTLLTWSMTGATVGNSAAVGINDISGTSFNSGVTTVTYHAEDASGNSSECTFTVTVNDTESPTVNCPANVITNNDAGLCSAVVNGLAPVTSDNCVVTLQTWSMSGATSGNSPATGINDISGTTFNRGITTVTYHVEDAAGNSDECNFTVTVNDIENPSVTCPADVTTNNDAGLCSAVVNGLTPTTSDNCGITLQTWSMLGATTGNSAATGINDISGTSFNVGTTTVTYHVEDAQGNFDECSFTVTVNDTENPTITCPADVSIIEDGSCSAVVNGLNPTTDDNCGVTLQTWAMVGATVGNSAPAGINDISGTVFNIGITTVTYHIEDAAGNFAECSFDVEVYDETYGGLIDADQSVCYNTIPAPFIDETSASVCGGLTYQWQKKSGTGTWEDIPGATNATYAEPNPLTEITYYNRKAISDLGFGTAYSDTITITIIPAPVADAGPDTLLCYDTPYYNIDADTTNAVSVTWSTDGGDGSFDDVNRIDATYTPGANDLLVGYVDLVLTAQGNAPCINVTDTVRVNYLSILRASIGKPTPYFIDSLSTEIEVYVRISNHRYIGDLGIYLVSPLDSVVELKPYCLGLPSATSNITLNFFNDAQGTMGLSTISTCSPTTGSYKFSGDWKKKLHNQDPANGAWRIRIVDALNISGPDGFLEEAAIKFTDLNQDMILEDVLYADSSIHMPIKEYSGSGPYARTVYVLPITGLTTSCYDLCDATAVVTASGGQKPYVSYEWSTSLDFSSPFATNDTVDLCPGKFYVRVTDSHGCTAIDSVTVGSPPEIKITNATVVNNVCHADSIGEVTLEFTGGTGALTYTYDTYTGAPKNSGETFDKLKAGTYLFTITDISGCTKDTLITITEPLPISITTNVTDISCYGQADASIEIIATGGTPGILIPYQYSIDSADTWHANNIFTPLDEGRYIIVVQDSLGCLGYGDTITLVNPAPISIDSVKTTAITCNGNGADGTITVYATGGTGTLQYSLDKTNYQASNLFTNLIPGTYSVYVIDDCNIDSLIDAAVITAPVPITIDAVSITDATCYGDSAGIIQVTASGGTGVFEYLLDGVLNNPSTNNTFIKVTPGNHTITVQDDAGCLSPDSIVNVGPEEIIITNSTVVNALCYESASGEVTLEFTGGTGALTYTYDTYTGTPKNSGETFENLAAGSYLFTVTDANGCTIDSLITITEPSPITVTTNVTDVTCYGQADGSIEIIATGGTPGTIIPYQYSIDSADTWHTNNIFTPLDAGRYIIVVQDSLGCLAYGDTIQVVNPDAISIDSVKTTAITCNGNGADGTITVYATGGTGALQYSLDKTNYQASNIFTNLIPGSYSVYVIDDCNIDSLIDGAVIPDVVPVEISQVDISDVNTCYGDNTGQIVISAIGGSGTYEYSINGGAGYQNENTFNFLSARPYTLRVRDDDGCLSQDSIVTVGQPDSLIIQDIIVVHNSECNTSQDLGRITINATGGTNPYTYIMVTESNLDSATNTVGIFGGLSVDNYRLYVVDNHNCITSRLDTSIIQKPGMKIDLSPINISCYGFEDGKIFVNVQDSTGNCSYAWTGPDSYSLLTSADSITDLTAGTYTVTVTDSNFPEACKVTNSIEIIEPEILRADVTVKDKFCITTEAIDPVLAQGALNADGIGGTPTYNYYWADSDGSVISSSDYLTNLDPGVYNLTITDSNGCTKDTSVTIASNNSYDITNLTIALEDNSLCWYQPASFIINFDGFADTLSYQIWYDNFVQPAEEVEITSNPVVLSKFLSEEYSYTTARFRSFKLTNDYCIKDANDFTISYYPDFNLDIIDDDFNPVDDTLYLKGARSGNLAAYVTDATGFTFSWLPIETVVSPGQQATVIQPDSSRWYTVIATSSDGCIDTSRIFLEFIPAITPNDAFSPNGDGINDYWRIKYIDKFPNNIVKIYSRWGIEVFEQKGYNNNDPSLMWDGKSKSGHDLPSGTYYYIIILNEAGFDPITGPITIVR